MKFWVFFHGQAGLQVKVSLSFKLLYNSPNGVSWNVIWKASYTEGPSAVIKLESTSTIRLNVMTTLVLYYVNLYLMHIKQYDQ